MYVFEVVSGLEWSGGMVWSFVGRAFPRPPTVPLWGFKFPGALLTSTAPKEPGQSVWVRDGQFVLRHVGWFFLVFIVLAPAAGRRVAGKTTPLDARVAVLALTVDVESAGLALHVSTPPAEEAPLNSKGRAALRAGRSLWLADTGLGTSSRDLGRAARELVQRARLDRGAMASHVQVSLRAGQQVGDWEMYVVQRALEDGLEGRPGFTAPATLRIALSSGPWNWASGEGVGASHFSAMRSERAQ